jgi:ABC-type polysaccharide/polyol phosphate transport system ATPase subunit
MHTALQVDGLAKQYRIYDKPADRLKELLTRGYLKRHREFWALKNISFAIQPGTTTGIIGPNGSGKSTLLQIIAGTLNPTHGSVHVEGRVGALLELGAGFNLEFTGIENVYMNSALMGFSRDETTARLSEIERFAELGEFINQPVKTYSSGMFVRLAFALAVNSDPDILIVDEALSVGDTIFQHRCVRRIKGDAGARNYNPVRISRTDTRSSAVFASDSSVSRRNARRRLASRRAESLPAFDNGP